MMNSNDCENVSNVSSSSSSSTAPQDFNTYNHLIESELIDNMSEVLNDKKSELNVRPIENSANYLLRCPVCCCNQKVFFCADCVKTGVFTHSKERFAQRFAEKKLKFFKLKSEQMLISDKIEQQLKHKIIRDELEFKIRSIEANVEKLNKALTESKQKFIISNNNLMKTKQNQNECKERHNRLITKVNDVKQYLIHRQNSNEKKVESKENLNSLVKELIQQRVCQLTSYIFPIEAISSDENIDFKSLNSSETTPLLTISDSNTFNTNYSVIEPWIPGNGDYSAFTLFASRKDFQNKESNFRNSEYRIGAALAYITQLMNIIAFYLDIRLPKRLSFGDFINDLNETLFAHKVAKLNANILYLCLSQNVNSELLHPRQTVKNLLQLLDSTSFTGIRNGPIIIKADFMETIENCLLDDLIDEPEIEDFNCYDPDEELTDFDFVEHNIPDLNFMSSGQDTSIAIGFISTAAASVASFWKTATGQR